MNRNLLATKFVDALARQVTRKSQMKDGINHDLSPLKILASIAEELGETASDLARERYYGAIAECIDVAHSALLLAITLDEDGKIMDSLFMENK